MNAGHTLFPVLSGILAAMSFPPFGIYPLIMAAFVPLLFSVHGRGWKNGFRAGMLTGLTFFSILIWWIAPAISVYGKMPWLAAWPVTLLLVIYLSVFTGIWGGFAAFTASGNPDSPAMTALNILSLAAAWIIPEWVRGTMIMGGFPWGSLAYALAPAPWLIQSASIWGIYGISFLIVAINASIHFIIRNYPAQGKKQASATVLPAAAIAVSLLLLCLLSDNSPDRPGSRIHAAALQGAFPQDVKWNPGIRMKTIETYRQLGEKAFPPLSSDNTYPRLAVWPETALPFYFQQADKWHKMVLDTVNDYDADTITGSQSYSYDAQGGLLFMNSAWMINRQGEITGRYDKQRLVPFGEYLPLERRLKWLRRYMPTAGNFVPGPNNRPLVSGKIKAGVLICFESIFPEQARQAVLYGANLLAVITNDAWFGKTGAPYQHADIAIFRAVENARWLIRSANTGISEIISPQGEIISKSRLFKPDIVSGMAELLEYQTFYTLHGNGWFVGLCMIFAIAGIACKKH